MVLQNYVILETGRPARLHFTAHDIVPKTITDPLLGRPKGVSALVFQVDELNGRPVTAQYSTLSQKHANDFAAFLPGQRYRAYDFIITAEGEGWRREYRVQVIARPE